jgi:hypothetical protein
MKYQSPIGTLAGVLYFVFIFNTLQFNLSGCSIEEPTAPASTFAERTEGVFPGIGAAKVKLGDSFAQIRSVHGEPEVRGGYQSSLDSTKYDIYWITYTAKGIKVYLKDVAYSSGLKETDISLEIVVMSPYNVKTDKGIGIGSSINQLITAYGQPGSITTISNKTWYDYQTLGIDFGIQSSAIITMGVYAPH